MRKIREVLRLAAAGHSRRRIARSCSSSHSTVCDYLRRAQEAGLSWPLVTGMDDAELERRLFPPVPPSVASARGVPDWSWVHRELRCPGVTLWLLWQEYKFTHPDGYQYSWFCNHYRAWAAKTEVVMRQTYRAGEVMFVDYAGQTIAIVERDTGAIHQAQIFVAVLGASNYTYAEASWSQTLPDWLAAHVRAFEAFGGVPEVVVPDNLKSGVHQPHRYEPELNPSYAELAAHYSVAVIPARVRKPRDKAKVEVGVQVVERWLLARLRHRTFFSLDELNGVLRPLLQALNERPFKKLPGSRHQWFETLERPALAPLPAERYVFAQGKKAPVNIDYHIDIDRHYYSVPYQLVRQEVDVRLSAHTLEVFHRGQRVASHRRNPHAGRHTTVTAHMPKAHRDYAEWTPQRLVHWAEQSGPHTATLVAHILAARAHPQQGYRSCLGILRLGKSYGADRLEAACQRALAIQAFSYKSVESILKRGLDRQPLPPMATDTPLLSTPRTHANIRGPHYYH